MGRKERVIVVGTGMCGIFAASMLAKHFKSVILLEKDVEPENYELNTFRKGVPQSFHVHGILKSGFDVLDEYFPGLQESLEKADLVSIEEGYDLPVFSSAKKWLPRRKTGIKVFTFSRMFIENCTRKMIQKVPNIEIRYRSSVLGLSMTGKVVSGVRVSTVVEGSASKEEILQADLIIDASGRNSGVNKWLKDIGVEAPKDHVFSKEFSYASKIIKLSPNAARNWKSILVRPNYQSRRGFVMRPVENGCHHLTVTGDRSIFTNFREEGLIDFARSVDEVTGMPLLLPELQNSESITDVRMYAKLDCVVRPYYKVQNWPQGLLIIGDSLGHLDPTYGQGMTLSAMGVRLLDKELAAAESAGRPIDHKSFYVSYIKQVDSFWWLATNGNLLSNLFVGESAVAQAWQRVKNRYAAFVSYHANSLPASSVYYFNIFVRVRHGLAEKSELFNPLNLVIGLVEANVRKLLSKFANVDAPYVPTVVSVSEERRGDLPQEKTA